jgi:outer membrane protein
MKIFRAIAAVAFCAAFMAGSAWAQPRTGTTPTQPRPTSTTTAATSGPIPDSKVAVIDSGAFQDEKVGITKVVTALKRLNSEFQPRATELTNLDQQIQKLEADLQKAAPVQDPKVTQQQQDKIDSMKRDLQRKNEDYQAAVNKRLQEVRAPLYEDIGKALTAFAKAKGITLILDVNQVQGLFVMSDAVDVTNAFIADYNSKNPATASLTQPQ